MLVVLYFLTMVLLPYGHMPLHASDHAEAAEGHHGCRHDPSDQDSKSDSGDECSLCHLTILLSDVPTAFSFSGFHLTLASQAHRASVIADAPICFEHKARAPPYMTV